MSPSRRRAIGAVRGVASREIRTRIYRTRPQGTAHYLGGAMVARGGSPPRPTAITPAKFARAFIAHDHGARRIARAARWSAVGTPGSRHGTRAAMRRVKQK